MKPIENDYTKTSGEEEDVINLREIIELILRNWYWFAISIVACVFIAFVYLMTVSPTYQRNAVMLIKSDKKAGADATAITLLELSGGLSGGGVENEMYILSSHQLVKEVVKRLNLDVTYVVRNGLRKQQLYKESPVRVLFQASFNELPFALEIVPLSSEKYRIVECSFHNKGSKDPQTVSVNKEYDFGKSVETPLGYITVTPELDNIEEYTGKSVYVSRIDLNKATDNYRERIKTSLIAKQSTLIKIECTDTNIPRADDILNKLIEAYNESIIEDKNRIASNTRNFIDERIKLISKELEDVEEDLTSFKQKNRLVNIDANAKVYLEESSKAKEEYTKLETELYVARSIKEYITDVNRRNQLIPNVSGVGDASIQNQINSYNEILIQRNRLVANSGENNPVVMDLDQNLLSTRETISGSIDNLLKTLELKLQKARDLEGRLMYNIQSVPNQEKTVISITRQQELKSALYIFLLNKREETSLQLAVTEADLRVVEAPFGTGIPVAPRKMIILFIALILGFALPLGVYIIYFLWDTSVHGRKDIEKYTTLPILGEIPPRKKEYQDEDIVVSEDNTRITEAFRLLRTNLDFMAKDKHVIVFTSTLAGEGKTFISRNLAVTFAFSGKRVILVDTDLRKRTQSRLSGTNNNEGLSTYLSGHSSNVKDLIINKALHPLVDMIPAGPMPPNPSELLMSERLELLIEELKGKYDYIIFDNIPALVVADAVIINRVADLTIYVIRDGKLDRRYLPELEKLHREKRFKNMCVVLNDSKVEKKYGYGYGYGEYYYSSNRENKLKKLLRGKKKK